MSDWIKMSDKKPEVGSKILIFYDGMFIDKAEVNTDYNGGIWLDLGDTDIGYEDSNDVDKVVTHWMPIPEPPID